MTEKLNKFTTYKYLLSILNDGLYFSDGKNWPDKNDSELLEIYRKQSGKEITVVCLMKEDETIYHWQSFTNGSCSQEVCCIEFDKEKLLSIYNTEKGFRSRAVEYASIDDVVFDTPEKLLFTKRLPYRNEREFRIVYFNSIGEVPKPDIEKFLQAITKITMSGNLSPEEYIQRKDYLKKKYSFKDNQINQSTIEKNPFWINKAKIQSGIFCNNEIEKIIIKNDSCKRDTGCQYYTIKTDRFRHSETSNYSTIVTISIDDYVVAMGAIQVIESEQIRDIRRKYNLNIDNNLYELSFFFIRDDYSKTDFNDIMLSELLKHYEGDNIIVTISDLEKDIQNALVNASFSRTQKNGDDTLYIKTSPQL